MPSSRTSPDVEVTSVVVPTGRFCTAVFFVTILGGVVIETAVGFTSPPVGCDTGLVGTATVFVVCTGVSGGGSSSVVDSFCIVVFGFSVVVGTLSVVVGTFVVVVGGVVVIILVVGGRVAENTKQNNAMHQCQL